MLAAMSDRVFITGGAGFIGSHVVDEFLAKGYEVLVYDNFSVGRREHLQDHENLQVIEGDITDESSLTAALQDFAPMYVVHMAAIHFIPYCNEHPMETLDVNVKGTEQLFQSLKTLKPKTVKRVVFASSAAVYGPSETPHLEECTASPTDIYGFTKYANEMQGQIFHESTGIETIAARIFNAYGPRETNPHLIPEIFQQYRQGSTSIQLGNLTTTRSYVFVKDLARGLVTLVESNTLNSYDVCNIGSHAEYNAKQILERLSEAVGSPITCVSTAERQRKSDRPRLQPDLKKIEAMGWSEQYEINSGLSEILAEEL
jgi:UDP-glucose 4-epimerase